VSRAHAIEILDEILANWKLVPADKHTITGINLSRVQQSELERMFKTLLHRWGASGAASVVAEPDPANPKYLRFTVRFENGPQWEIREQVKLPAHNTIPDFYATRTDTAGQAPVAIYLDGWEFHGMNAADTDRDAGIRDSLRSSGIRVWALTWTDVKAALSAIDNQTRVGPLALVSNKVRLAAKTTAVTQHGSDSDVFEALEFGAFDQMMHALREPDDAAWAMLMKMLSLQVVSGSEPIWFETAGGGLEAAIDALATGELPAGAPSRTDSACWTWSTSADQAVATVLTGAQERVFSVVSYDSASAPEKNRWSDWLHLGNLLQYIGDDAVITTTRNHIPGFIAGPEVSIESGSESETEVAASRPSLEDTFDRGSKDLANAMFDAGFGDFEVGVSAEDSDDTPIEILWRSAKVGIVVPGGNVPSMGDGWQIRPSDEWSNESLLAALRGSD